MAQVRRNKQGQLTGGSRLNPEGRRGKRRLVTPADFRQAIIAISQRPATGTSGDGGTEPTTLYGWHILNLAIGTRNRLASKDFVALVDRVTEEEEKAHRAPDLLAKFPDKAWALLPVPDKNTAAPVKRNGRGQFTGSGNVRGRPKKKEPPLSEAHAELILDNANRCVVVNGRKITLFEAQVLKLGTASGGERVATRTSIIMALDTAISLDRRRRHRLAQKLSAAWRSRQETDIRAMVDARMDALLGPEIEDSEEL